MRFYLIVHRLSWIYMAVVLHSQTFRCLLCLNIWISTICTLCFSTWRKILWKHWAASLLHLHSQSKNNPSIFLFNSFANIVLCVAAGGRVKKMGVRTRAVDAAGFISYTVYYTEGIGAWAQWGTSAAIKKGGEKHTAVHRPAVHRH